MKMNKINVARDAEDFSSPYKVALVASHDEQGDVHITLLSSLMNRGDREMIVGEFVEGSSKTFFHERPKAGFLIMNQSMCLWTGTMDFYDSKMEGEEYIAYNKMPLYRFNTYCGIHRVHYATLRNISDKKKLNLAGIVANTLRVALRAPFSKGDDRDVFNAWTRQHTKKMTTLYFIGFTDREGYPRIVPIIQGRSNSNSRVLFTLAPYKKDLSALVNGQRVSIFALNLDMEAVLLKGTYLKKRSYGTVDVDRVYNCMPPIHRYIYPEIPWETVEAF